MNNDYLKTIFSTMKMEIKKMKVESLISNQFEKKVCFDPYYQRNYIWNDNKATKLIETVLIRGEIPPIITFYYNDIYEIIDGRQRYETILRFFNDKFTLKKDCLTVLKELGGYKYSKLPENVKTIFKEYRFRILIYSPEYGVTFSEHNLEIIKRNLFRRYNFGMTALNKSEIARARYLYDELTNELKKHFIKNKEDYELCANLFLAPSKRKIKDNREKINLLLMNAREVITMPYIPIIGVKNVSCSNSVIDKYYNKIILNINIIDKKNEFIKISKLLYKIKYKLDYNNLPNNVIFFKGIYWMLSLIYKEFPDAFYDFNIDKFIHYLEENDYFEYFDNYKSLSSNNIINRHIYLKKYINDALNFKIDNYLENLIEENKVSYKKSSKKIKNNENWKGISEKKQNELYDDKFSVKDIIKLIKENRFIIRPVYQRKEIGNIEKYSRIIESIILGIKIPPIYVLKEDNQYGLTVYTVVDGQQRLISILRFLGEQITDDNFDFINNTNKKKKNYKLSGLVDLEYLNNKTYNDENPLNENYKKIINDYEIDVMTIDKDKINDFNVVDMFLRLNENPCNISKNTFEMWNSFEIINSIKKIKEVAKYPLLKQSGNKMKEEELVTILAYMKFKNINVNNMKNFFKIYIQKENKDRMEERIEIKISISNKGNITKLLEKIKPESHEEIKFLECINCVQKFTDKLNKLSDDNQILINIFNPYLKVPRKANMKDIYIMALLLNDIDNHVIKTYKKEILSEVTFLFKLMKNFPSNKNVDFFIEYLQSLVEKYQSISIQ